MIRRPRKSEAQERLHLLVSTMARNKLAEIAGPFSWGMVVEELILREHRRRKKYKLHHSQEKS